MKSFAAVVALAFGLTLSGTARASDIGYIYGRVVTVDGDSYEGQLRWGKEEAFWDDLFNATKTENENLGYLDRQEIERLGWKHPLSGIGLFIGQPSHSFTHVFAVRFGDLAGLEIQGGHDVVAAFRNGDRLKLDDGSNDVGAEITVMDPRVGRRTLEWNQIRTVEFMEAPDRLERKLGEPLYGTVKAGDFEYTGRIQWDNDECLSVDELDGYTRDGKVHLPFAEIASIRKHLNGARVRTTDGDDLFLTGTNDVNHENRGIVVKIKGIGSVKIGWNDFDEVTFRPAPNSGPGYEQFADGRTLRGAVSTRDDRYAGRIVFDLDETWDFELLQGTIGSTEYLIPFREIARITPKGSRRSDVELRNGATIELEDGQDVSRKNDGLLVFPSGHDPRYVAWRDVEAVEFR